MHVCVCSGFSEKCKECVWYLVGQCVVPVGGVSEVLLRMPQ